MIGREWRFLTRLWRVVRRPLTVVVVVTGIGMAAKSVTPVALKRAFDGLAGSSDARAVATAALVYLAIGLVDRVLGGSLVFLRANLNARFEWMTRTRAFGSLVKLGPGFMGTHRTGDLVTRLTDDVAEKLAWFACSGVFRALGAAAVIAFAFVAMASIDPWLAAIVAVPMPLLTLLHVRTGRPLQQRYDAVQASLSDLNAALEACFSGIRVVKAYGRERGEEEVVGRLARSCASAEIAAVRRQVVMDALYSQGWQVGVAAVLLAGGLWVMSGRLTLGTLVAFDAYAFLLAWPMLDIGAFLVRGRQAAASIGRLLEIEEARPEVTDPPLPQVPVPGESGRIRFEDVTWIVEGAGRRVVFENVSFDAGPGERVAVVGPVGCGKSRLLRLAPRLMDPTSGRVVVEGVDARDWPLAALRDAVAFVPQEATLFSGTVRSNIAFWRDVDDQAVARAARMAQLDRDLAAWSDGLETRVGVRGVTLSGGQGQRVSLARALAGRPRILVLDDVTSALDAETEAALWAELERALPGLTVVLATHRTATLERADRIIVLDEGRVVQAGRHAELLRAGGLYGELYRRHAREERVGDG